MKTFNLGDRVLLDPPMPNASACTHGIVVPHYGKHRPKEPRVRWAEGWGTSVPAKHLRLLTPEEAATLPTPALCHVDYLNQN
jgi:hypothetical protein